MKVELGNRALLTIAALVALLASPRARAAAQQESDSSASLVTVSGTVYDSLSARPLAGALVQMTTSDLQGLIYSGRTDLLGSFSIPGVQTGDYIIGFTHPFLDSLGLDVPPMKLKVGSGLPRLSLAIPAPHAVRSLLCPGTESADSSGLLLGFLRDADSGAHLDSGSVVLEWTEVRVSEDGKSIIPLRRSASAEASGAGWYAICGVPTGGPVAARATVAGMSSGYIDVRIPPRGVLHRDFLIPPRGAVLAVVDTSGDASADTLERGHARLTVTVRRKDGKPLSEARVEVHGSGIGGTTDDDGRLTLTGLPAGTRTLEVRHIGYAPARAAVDLASDRTASTTVTLDKIADVLSEVKVYGKQSASSRRLEGFRQRMRAGFGHFITRADIERQAPLRLTDVVRGIPGVTVERSGAFDYRVTSSLNRRCVAAVYVDGHQLIRPTLINDAPSTAILQNDAPTTRVGRSSGATGTGSKGTGSGGSSHRVFVAGGHMSDNDFVSINDLVWLDNVVGVEVYSSSFTTPAEFRGGGGGGCPVVVIWTSMDADALDRANGGRQ
ncbi:MAG TPA: carboxypeptidase regulatory-like domain-containing protein [Gemmatimonadaceae bacterium]|nr:carboxypeptidase regulatory-like domain-containing protein [Gemmatimonadaceae bacterium]